MPSLFFILACINLSDLDYGRCSILMTIYCLLVSVFFLPINHLMCWNLVQSICAIFGEKEIVGGFEGFEHGIFRLVLPSLRSLHSWVNQLFFVSEFSFSFSNHCK